MVPIPFQTIFNIFSFSHIAGKKSSYFSIHFGVKLKAENICTGTVGQKEFHLGYRIKYRVYFYLSIPKGGILSN